LATSRSPTERDQREFARVATALYRHDAQGFGHAGVDDFDNPLGRFVNGEPERIGDPTYRRFCGCEVDLSAPPSRVLRSR
jgi:hypothetical protein